MNRMVLSNAAVWKSESFTAALYLLADKYKEGMKLIESLDYDTKIGWVL